MQGRFEERWRKKPAVISAPVLRRTAHLLSPRRIAVPWVLASVLISAAWGVCVLAPAWGQGLAADGSGLSVGGLGLGLEAARFDVLSYDARAYGQSARGMSAATVPPARNFDPSRARPRATTPDPAASLMTSGGPVAVSSELQPLPHLQETLPLLVRPVTTAPAESAPAATVTRPMNGPPVGIRPRVYPLPTDRRIPAW